MLVKSVRANPSVLLFLLFCAVFGWQLSAGGRYENNPAPAPPPKEQQEQQKQQPPPPPPAPPAPEKPKDPPKPQKPAKPEKPRIGIVTFVTNEHSYTHLSLRNKDHYARRHGYELIVDYEAHTERGTTYWKFDMMERLIKKNKWDWLWWVDFDTLITNTDIKVLDIINETLANVPKPDEIDYLTTHDCNGLNTGSFIVRSHERSIKFLHDIYDIHAKQHDKEDHLSEQDAMARLIETNKAQGDRTVQVPQWKLNAFPQEIACFDESRKVWEHGFFIIHFAGAWAHVDGEDPTGQLMTKYKDEIIWGDWKQFY